MTLHTLPFVVSATRFREPFEWKKVGPVLLAMFCMPSAWAASDITLQPTSAWTLKLEDVRIDKALKRWSKEAGYSFRWDADRYVLIAAPSVYEGDFLSAVREVLETPGIAHSEYPLEACVYSNNPPLLRVTRLGDQAEECK